MHEMHAAGYQVIYLLLVAFPTSCVALHWHPMIRRRWGATAPATANQAFHGTISRPAPPIPHSHLQKCRCMPTTTLDVAHLGTATGLLAC